ncbi:MAG TPA: LacI family DNA-binding transcriptional regulator [bacterium]|nr:LacI family DNA-binding transcriptional regulator [bacterium]
MTTIHDVARAARVSIATVSRVLNDNPRVSERTRRRVWAAADRLDYTPNSAARALTTRRTRTLGVLLPDLYGEFFSEVIRGVDRAAREADLQVLISSSHANTEEALSAARAMRGRIDGLIMMAPDSGSAEALRRLARGTPVVVINPRKGIEGCRAVSIANFEGSYGAVKHLIELGHTSLATVSGPRRNVDAEERLRGFRRALRDQGLEPAEALIVRGDFTESSGHRAATEILGNGRRPTAVFAANDSMAIGLLSALGDLGVRVPGDLAVVGFDDIAIARYLTPPLTTVRVDASELGARAVRRLLEGEEFDKDDKTGRPEVLPAPLVVRRSCGATGNGRVAGGRKAPRRPRKSTQSGRQP